MILSSFTTATAIPGTPLRVNDFSAKASNCGVMLESSGWPGCGVTRDGAGWPGSFAGISGATGAAAGLFGDDTQPAASTMQKSPAMTRKSVNFRETVFREIEPAPGVRLPSFPEMISALRSGGLLLQEDPKKDKKRLPLDAEVSAAEVVLREELAGRAEAADLFHVRGRGSPASAEEFGGLEFLKRMPLVVLAYRAVLPADLPVLFGIRYRILAGAKHLRLGLR